MQATDHDRLALAAARPLQQRRADRRGAKHALAVPQQRQDQVHRLVGIAALAEGDAAQRGQQAVMRREIAPGATHAIGRHPGVDQARVGGGQGRGVKAQRLKFAGRVAEQGDIGAGDERASRRQPIERPKVEGQDLFVAVPGVVARMVLQPVAARELDLNHLSFEVAQQHRRHGPGLPLAEIDDTDAPVG